MKNEERKTRLRLFFCLMFFLCGFSALAVRVWQLHVMTDDRVSRLQNRQVNYSAKLTLRRGNIYDIQGRELALSVKTPSIFADPSMLEGDAQTVKKLSSILGMSVSAVKEKLKQGSRKFAWIKRYVDPTLNEKLKDLDGVYSTFEWKRFYPERELAAQVLGVVSGEGQGVDGLESMYNDYLKTQDVTIKSEKDAKGRVIFTGNTDMVEGKEGADIYLTIDTTIQHLVERELRKAADQSQSRAAMGVVMDPNNGKILAMASYPSVNLNRMDNVNPAMWKNQAIIDVFEPGSTFKVFTMAAALEQHTLSAKKIYNCKEGSLVVSNKKIRNIIKKDELSAEGILKYSNNVGTARIGLDLGAKRLEEVLRKLGFGEKTGIHFPLESRGLMSASSSWRPVDLANISFGQGIGVTAIQMATALSVVANGGFSVQPKLVEKAVFPDKTEKTFVAEDDHDRILSPDTVKLLTKWMQTVVQDGGTGTRARIDGVNVAGKTGTAQVIDDTNAYSWKLVNSSFMGFAPAENPRLVGFFVFREPKNSEHGGELAAPVFKTVIGEALNYLGVERNAAPVSAMLASGMGLPLRIKATKPAEQVETSEGQVPDLRGLTIREVMRKTNKMDVQVKVVGSGVAVKQEPKPGSVASKSKTIKVFFESSRKKRPL